MTGIVNRRRAARSLGAWVLGLALASSGCTGVGWGPGADELFDSYDADGDDMLGPAEWDQVHIGLDLDGDGAVSRDEFNGTLGGGR